MAGRSESRDESGSENLTRASEVLETVRLHFVNKPSDLTGEGVVPAYTHYFFHDSQVLDGYVAVEIDVFMHAGSIKPYFSVTYEAKGEVELKAYMQSKLQLTSCFNSPLELSAAMQTEFQPPGDLIRSFQKSSVDHQIYLASKESQGFLDIHPYINTLPIWFIDGASLVDISEPHWRYFLMYSVVEGRYVLIGLCSVYYFWTNLSSCRVRISQFVVLPQYQRQGYGTELLNSIYSFLRLDERVFEVTVEDCSEEFQRLRDTVDVSDALPILPWAEHGAKLSESDKITLQTRLKITKNQADRCLELIKLALLPSDKTSSDYTNWRIEVKRRLYKDNYTELKPKTTELAFKHIYIHDDSEAEEDLKALGQIQSISPDILADLSRHIGMKQVHPEGISMADRKAALAEMFAALEEEYESVLPKVAGLVSARKVSS